MANNVIDHSQAFGPTVVNSGSTNVVVCSIDLNGLHLMNGAGSGGASVLYQIAVDVLAFNTSTNTYPFWFYFKEAVQLASGVYVIHSGTTPTAIKEVGAGGSISVNFNITSTSVFNIRVSNAGSDNYTAGGFIDPRMVRFA